MGFTAFDSVFIEFCRGTNSVPRNNIYYEWIVLMDGVGMLVKHTALPQETLLLFQNNISHRRRGGPVGGI